MFVDGDFNADLDTTKGNSRDEDIAADLVAAGLKDMLVNFLLCHNSGSRYGRMWSMAWPGKEVRYQMDYILGTDQRLFQNVSVQDPCHNTDHCMILGCICRATLR